MWINFRRAQSGFTLIELLVVIAIIGILATITTVSLTAARRRSRDTGRVANIRSAQNALELYFTNRADYPPVGAAITAPSGSEPWILGGADRRCLDDSDTGFVANCAGQTLLSPVPSDIAPDSDFRYYKPGVRDYTIAFALEGEIGDLRDVDGNGTIECRATPQGISCE